MFDRMGRHVIVESTMSSQGVRKDVTLPQPFGHALLRWYARRRLLEDEREATLAQLTEWIDLEHDVQSTSVSAVPNPQQSRLEERLRDIDRQIHMLGPSPQARMG